MKVGKLGKLDWVNVAESQLCCSKSCSIDPPATTWFYDFFATTWFYHFFPSIISFCYQQCQNFLKHLILSLLSELCQINLILNSKMAVLCTFSSTLDYCSSQAKRAKLFCFINKHWLDMFSENIQITFTLYWMVLDWI